MQCAAKRQRERKKANAEVILAKEGYKRVKKPIVKVKTLQKRQKVKQNHQKTLFLLFFCAI